MTTEQNKQLSNDELLTLTRQAFEKDEVAELLQGKNEYACPIDRYTPANVPTDFDRVVRFGIYKLYELECKERIIDKFKDAIIKLLGGDAIQVWVAYSICWSLIYNKHHNNQPFTINDNKFWNEIKSLVLSNENKLRECREWQGRRAKEGLWSDIKRMDNNLLNNYRECIL